MMMPLITDVVEESNLKNIRCGICTGFLSVKPISFDTQTGLNICGRCISKAKTTALEHNLSFELLAKQYSFPCVFAIQGCSITASFDEISMHEKSCTFRVSRCFCSWMGNSYNFIKHYEDDHQESLIESGDTFTIKNYRTCFLLMNRGLYFCVTYLYEGAVLQIHVTSLTSLSQDSKAIFTTKQCGSDNCFDVELDTLQTFNCNESSCMFTLTVDISDEYMSRIFTTIVCPNCTTQMTPPILRCSVGHVTCLQCTDDWLDYCKSCDTECEFTCDAELQCIALAAQFTCKWSCGKTFTSNEIREHEQVCEQRIYNCWHSLECSWNGYLNQLIAHDATCLDTLYGNGETCQFFLNVPEVSFLGTISTRSIYHLITYDCCFNVIYDRLDGTTSLFINHYDIHGFGWFRFVAELRHIEDINCVLNKTYEFTHTHGGIYKVRIPMEDIIKFGGCEFYKVSARIIFLNKEERRICTNDLYKRFRNFRPL